MSKHKKELVAFIFSAFLAVIDNGKKPVSVLFGMCVKQHPTFL
ncbi:hypothetical protein JCM19237_2116 [Photobacterium aphoticum]|uniref:Uncharacterized protein n=1 Tax=Photobacterium aphoticum TaxID=754436 RepID=A0A090QLF3_9GAMM|nr:hypothetical protein JCM19237_2116 [Photobacterium aphoticum]